MLSLTINGGPCSVAEGATVLDALHAAGVVVPTLCHDPRLAACGACRLCVVEVSGLPRPVTACNTRAQAGMEIATHTPALESTRRTNLRLLAKHYPAGAAAAAPEKEFHRALRQYGVAAGGTARREADTSHPYIRVDMSQCIDCYRCVRICDEVQGQFVWQAWQRGDATVIEPDSGTTLLESSCVSCGACVDTCPTGALEDKTVLALGAPTDWTRTTCPYCGIGCEMNVGTRDGRIVEVRPALDAPVNKGHLCVKGRYAFGFTHSPRARHGADDPRRGRLARGRRWPEALAYVAEQLRALIEKHGPDSIGVLGSARATNEDNYLDAEIRPRRARHEQRRLLRPRLPRADRGGDEVDARHRRGDQFLRRHRACARHPASAAPTRPRTIRSSARASSRPSCAARS